MKTITDKIVKGKRRVTVELREGEVLLAIQPGAHYRLGQPVDDVVGSHIIEAAERVEWCSASQAWVS